MADACCTLIFSPEPHDMNELYYGPTSNECKASNMLAETGLPYDLHSIDILASDHFRPDYLKINPNNEDRSGREALSHP
jgi:hypothetical protein